jgi:hypothetical protein
VLRKAAAAAAAGDRRNIMIRNGVVVVVVVAGGLLHARRQRNKEPCRAICCGWKRVAERGTRRRRLKKPKEKHYMSAPRAVVYTHTHGDLCLIYSAGMAAKFQKRTTKITSE